MKYGFEVRPGFPSLNGVMPTCMYLAGFEGDYVKVGVSSVVQFRLGVVKCDGNRAGRRMIRWDVFGPMLDNTHRTAEALVIWRLSELYETVPGTMEWFKGADFDRAFLICKDVISQPLVGLYVKRRSTPRQIDSARRDNRMPQ